MTSITKKKSKYEKLDPIDHVLLRSDMYTGSTAPKKSEEYIAIKDEDDTFKITKKVVVISPALLRIFIEPLSNSLDNAERSKKTKTKCTKIMVNINKETGETSVWNDGEIVPIEIHEEHGIYNHSLIFGQLMTSSNYDDEEERLVSGRNGMGVSLTNIFSKSFTVRGFDPNVGKILTQEWTNNMRDTKGAIVKDSKLKKGFTEVTWFPDFSRFGITGYTDDIISLYIKYVIDSAMLSGVKVHFNGEEIPVSNLNEYSKLYESFTDEKLIIKTKSCEILLTPCDEFQAISFVNGVYTRLGGQHVDAWCEAIFRPLLDKFNKKGKPQLNIGNIKQFFRIFVVATVDKPAFSSQEKDKLESPSIEVVVKPANINAIMKWSVVEQIEDIIRGKEMVVLKKTEKKKKGYVKIEGLDPANLAGGKFSSDCSLILCEGLSAKSYVVAGIEKGVYEKQGRNYFGILALRGKCLNVRNAIPTSIAKNNEISNVIKALGLRYETDYTIESNYKQLNYGKIIIITDADCFTDDTALLIKINNNVSIISIDSLYDNNKNGAQLIENIQVWSNTGWVDIKAIKQKKTKKHILTINTYCGIIRCTEDHKLLLENGDEIKACDIKLGDKLMRNRRINSISKINEDMSRKELVTLSKDLYCYNKSTSNTNKNDLKECIERELNYCTMYSQPSTDFYKISEEEAWVWGFFFADGTCGIYTYEKNRDKQTEINTINSRKRWEKWVVYHTKKIKLYSEEVSKLKDNGENYGKINRKLTKSQERLKKAIENTTRMSKVIKENMTRTNYSYSISNCDYSKLQKSYDIMKKIYPEYNWTLIEVTITNVNGQRAYRLVLNGGEKVNDFIQTMRDRFYTNNKLKKVPDEILNNTTEIQKSFFDGYYEGDGFRWLKENKNAEGFDILGQVGAQGLCYIVERLGYFYSIQEKNDKPNVFTVHISKRYRRFYPGEVKRIYETEYTDRYVYDIETETGKINAGIGNMIQRQCDGLHIEGLIMNFFHSLFPSLLIRKEPFIVSMKTPIVRVFKSKVDDLLFYDERNFKDYASKQTKKFDKKYYKGLGTTKPEDVPDTFGTKMVEYNIDENTNSNMNKVFHKKYSDDRKEWLANYNGDNYISLDNGDQFIKMGISNFLDGEMIKFSINDCKRSIPSGIDGLKESQRKILYSVKKRNLKYSGKSLKVAQLGGYVAEHTNYHHGEQNLYETITKMANEYPGTNNIPLLYRDGMFGTRLSNKDAASARYIFTKMDILTNLIFRPEDDILLEKVIDDGDEVEPKFYVPIIPMILANGVTAAIGSGWSCCIPNYNPLDLIKSIKIWLKNDGKVLIINEEMRTSLLPEIFPWYRDFDGTIEKINDNKYITYGICNEGKKKGTYNITELPIGMWTDKFKENLEDLLVEKQIKNIVNHSTTKKVNFTITEIPDEMNVNKDTLKMYTYLHTSNMVMFTEKEQIRKFENTDEIIDHFCIVRFEYYKLRKKHIINVLENEIKFLGNKERFIREVINKTLKIMNVPESEVITEMEKKGYDKLDKTVNKKESEKDEEDDEEDIKTGGSYDYLLRMQIRTFTTDKIDKLKNDIASKIEELKMAQNTKEENMWIKDLDELEKEYMKFLKIMNEEKPKKKK